jgi:ABC-2 type transport system ATP-binding protein
VDRGQPAVETRELTKRYGRFTALDRLNLTVERGEILGFVGPNGAGKTTTIKILVGLARPSAGWARVAGADCVAEARRIKRLVGYMPDTFGSYDNMRVSEYLDFFGAAFGIPRRERARRIGAALETAAAGSFRDLFVDALSHGMKQRVAIARTLLHDPEVLILDEPANGLDPQARIEMRRLLLELADRGKTLLVTSHILPELARVCHRVAIITRGRLRAFGTLEEISQQLHPMRPMEVLLTDAGQINRAAEVVARHIEPGAEVSPSAAEGVVRFRTGRREEELAGLLAALVAAGLGVAQFREVQTDLEEAFMTVARADSQPVETAKAVPVKGADEELVAGLLGGAGGLDVAEAVPVEEADERRVTGGTGETGPARQAGPTRQPEEP